MALLTASEWRVAEAIAEIGYTNPFLPERIDLEKKTLGKAFMYAVAWPDVRNSKISAAERSSAWTSLAG